MSDSGQELKDLLKIVEQRFLSRVDDYIAIQVEEENYESARTMSDIKNIVKKWNNG